MLFEPGNYNFNSRLNFGDNSITHRAFICGALAEGTTEIENACICRDTLSTADCLKKMGADFVFRGTSVTVYPLKALPSRNEPLVLDCGNSGTTARLLAGVAAGLGIRAVFKGDASLSRRPMDRVILPLREMGFDIRKTDNALFVTGDSTCVRDERELSFETSSAQVKGALLFAALVSGGTIKITEKVRSRNHTEIMLSHLGARIKTDGNEIRLEKSRIKGAKLKIPNDVSTAAFFIAHGLLGDGAVLNNVGVNPTRTEYISLLKESGANIEISNEKNVCGEAAADISVTRSALKPFICRKERSRLLLDEIPALAVLALTAKGRSKFEGVGELAAKESDRLAGVCGLAKSLGADAAVCGDCLEIYGKGYIEGGQADTLNDHRLELAAATAGLHSKRGVETSFGYADVSCPDFLKIIGAEKFRLGLLGGDISSSKSPLLFSLFSDYFSVPLSYELFETDAARFDDTLKKLKTYADGFNVTMPYKSRLSSDGMPSNTVLNKCGRFLPAVTDGDGVVLSLAAHKIDVEGKKLLLIGAGGSAAAAARALADRGAKLCFANRTQEKARESAIRFGGKIYEKGVVCDGILSFVPVFDRLLFADEKDVAAAEFVLDAYYFRDTRLLQCARKYGKIAVDGLDMLFFQAIKAFEIFTSVKASDTDTEALYALFRSKI